MTKKSRRAILITSALLILGVAVALITSALRDNIVFFYGPTEAVQKAMMQKQRMRIGGLVKQGSVARTSNHLSFIVTDNNTDVSVDYQGQVPDLFREGQGVVAEGRFDEQHIFRADNVLAKHDERYMPREVADALKKQGVWNEGLSRNPTKNER
jgi:cytochrome c-type biogenesis protein CcmE